MLATQLVACQVGIKDNPSDRTQPQLTAVASTDEAEGLQVQEESATKAEELAQTEPEESSEAKSENAEKTEKTEKAETAATTVAKTAAKTEVQKTEPTAPAPDYPSVAEVQKELKARDFTFYVNNLIKDPEPQSVVYGDKKVGKAELTVLYAIFKSVEEADLAIANLLESDMIGKAISFGAKLDKPVDKSGDKVYTVSLSSFLATARAEMRQDGERVALVLLYKKNDDVQFAPYFELMGFDKH